MWFVYLIQSKANKEKYIGFTQDIERRLNEHNSGISKYTSRQAGYWELIYFEAYKSEQDALIREKRLKEHGKAKQELYKRLDNSILKQL